MTNQAQSRDSFILYRSFIEATKNLLDKDRLQIFDAIADFALDGNLPSLQGIPATVFTLIRPQLEANRRKWQNGCKEKKKPEKEEADLEQNGSKSEAKDKQTESKPEGNVNVNDNGNENFNENANAYPNGDAKQETLNIKPKSEPGPKITQSVPVPDFIDAELWNGFLEMRRKKKAPPTEIAIKSILKRLEEFENQNIGNANEALRNSLENSWKGVFEPKHTNSRFETRTNHNLQVLLNTKLE